MDRASACRPAQFDVLIRARGTADEISEGEGSTGCRQMTADARSLVARWKITCSARCSDGCTVQCSDTTAAGVRHHARCKRNSAPMTH